jgi:ABC-2 type transport system ATP-binding protein
MSHINPVIQTDNLTKTYGSGKSEVFALKSLNLSVQQGEIFGYLGPNGAGKTTTIRTLLDIIRPTMGHARVFGMDSRGDAVEIHKRVGFLPGELNLWKNLTGLQVLNYINSVRGTDALPYARELAERLLLDLSIRVRNYSSGNKRKLGLVIALMHRPELVILDEPTNGLDPLMQQTFNELMREVRAAGRTVFLSSHILSEVQAICDRVGILRSGELKAVETVTSLTHADFRWVTLEFRDSLPVGWTDNLSHVPGVSDIHLDGSEVKLRLIGDFDPLLRAVDGAYIVDMHVEEPSLEEIFLTYYGNGGAKSAPMPEKEMAR